MTSSETSPKSSPKTPTPIRMASHTESIPIGVFGSTTEWMISASNNQDYTVTGVVQSSTYEDGFEYLIVLDGHGSGVLISRIKDLLTTDWDNIMNSHDEIEALKNTIGYYNLDTFKDGATLSIVKIYKNHFVCKWMGDSKILIFEDNHLIFESCSHNYENKSEYNRVMHECALRTDVDWSPSVIDDKTITMKQSNRFTYNIKQNMVDSTPLTRCLGHNSKPGDFADIIEIPRTQGRRYKVILASDGVWDMIEDCKHTEEETKEEDGFHKLNTNNYTAQQLCEFAYNRWKQSWRYVHGDTINPSIKFPDDNTDDICAIIWSNY
jgi:serine/threonine protein phosphatase PrpC